MAIQGFLSSLEWRVQFCLLVCCTYPSLLTVNKEKNRTDQRASLRVDTRETQQIHNSKLTHYYHVQERKGTRLHNLKNSMKGRPSADGKTIGGKGRLTDQQIGKMQQYYGNAIRENKGDIVTMSVVEIVYIE